MQTAGDDAILCRWQRFGERYMKPFTDKFRLIIGGERALCCSLTTVEVIHQTVGRTSSLRLQMSALTCDECAAIPWDELQVNSCGAFFAHRAPYVYM